MNNTLPTIRKVCPPILVLAASMFFHSCSRSYRTTPSGFMVGIHPYDTTSGDTSAVILTYAKGSNFASAIQVTDTVPVVADYSMVGLANYELDYGHDYLITFLPSGKQHRIQGVSHGNNSTLRGPIGGEPENCINSFSYTLDNKKYNQDEIGLGHSNMTGIDYYRILVE